MMHDYARLCTPRPAIPDRLDRLFLVPILADGRDLFILEEGCRMFYQVCTCLLCRVMLTPPPPLPSRKKQTGHLEIEEGVPTCLLDALAVIMRRCVCVCTCARLEGEVKYGNGARS